MAFDNSISSEGKVTKMSHFNEKLKMRNHLHFHCRKWRLHEFSGGGEETRCTGFLGWGTRAGETFYSINSSVFSVLCHILKPTARSQKGNMVSSTLPFKSYLPIHLHQFPPPITEHKNTRSMFSLDFWLLVLFLALWLIVVVVVVWGAEHQTPGFVHAG